MDKNDLAMIAKAAELANRSHFTCKQVRKGTGLPYIVHPFRVATLVTDAGGNANQIAAAWCHDVLEDCEPFRVEANATLPAPVLALVKELTKAEISPGKRVKGEAFMAEIRAMSPEAKLVKACDRLDNLRDVRSANKPDWARTYGKESVEVLKALAVDPAMGPQADQLLTLIGEQIEANRKWADEVEGVGPDGLTDGERANLEMDERMAVVVARDPSECRRRRRERRDAEVKVASAFAGAMSRIRDAQLKYGQVDSPIKEGP